MVEPHALFGHILAQTRQNVELLMAHKQIPEADGKEILSRLSVNAERRSEESSVALLTQKTQRLSMSPAPPKAEARAIWGWSSDDPNDLAFEVGEIIEVIAETNADWWTGRNRSGKQGLFPSTYVEKLPPRGLSPILVPEPRKSISSFHSKGSEERRYPSPALPHPMPQASPQAYPAVPQTHFPPPGGYYTPPGPPPGAVNYAPPGPPPGGVNYAPPGPPPGAVNYAPPGPPPGAVNYSYAPPAGPPTPQPMPQQMPAKKSKFGGLGQTMAQSAAGGVGFGAGAAIGSGLVNSIF